MCLWTRIAQYDAGLHNVLPIDLSAKEAAQRGHNVTECDHRGCEPECDRRGCEL